MPKRASGRATDLGESDVRDYVLRHGRVDVKVCAIDPVWSGLKRVWSGLKRVWSGLKRVWSGLCNVIPVADRS